jgi:hypothetical protein
MNTVTNGGINEIVDIAILILCMKVSTVTAEKYS